MRATDVGDINSNDVGSGARFNAGKPDIGLLPLSILAGVYQEAGAGHKAINALYSLGNFQAGGDRADLTQVLVDIQFRWEDCARVFEYGKRKYAAWNWAKGMAWSVLIACAGRHLMAMFHGEYLDSESGEPHEGHVACNIFMLLLYLNTYPQGDDRPTAWLGQPEVWPELIGGNGDPI